MSDYEDNKIKIRVLDYLEEFTKAMFDSLGEGEKKYGNSWLKDFEVFNDHYTIEKLLGKFTRFRVSDEPINWAGVAGYAMIAWIRENHPELWEEVDAKNND